MSTRFYDTDLTDAAWALVAQVLPAARPGGRPRTTNLRAVLNAIFYLLRTGCQWRLSHARAGLFDVAEPLRLLKTALKVRSWAVIADAMIVREAAEPLRRMFG